MPASVVHLLTGAGDLRLSTVACGSPVAQCATWQLGQVTCAACLKTQRGPRPAAPGARVTEKGDHLSEKQLQELVRQACGRHGWLYYHCHTSRHSPAGFPDVIAVRGTRLVAAELKRQGQEPTAAQAQWLEGLGRVEQVHSAVWRPSDWEHVLEVLR